MEILLEIASGNLNSRAKMLLFYDGMLNKRICTNTYLYTRASGLFCKVHNSSSIYWAPLFFAPHILYVKRNLEMSVDSLPEFSGHLHSSTYLHPQMNENFIQLFSVFIWFWNFVMTPCQQTLIDPESYFPARIFSSNIKSFYTYLTEWKFLILDRVKPWNIWITNPKFQLICSKLQL